MTDRRNDPAARTFKGMLYLLSLIYGMAIFIRSMFYKYGLFNTQKIPLKVISVGNLTLGGTGKTPFVINLAEILRNDLRKEAVVLIRGYGWDEQAMLKRRLPDVPILVGEDRAKSGRRAVKLYGSDAAILDDGFQHWELHRDLDIVLIDSSNPFGNGHLFPRGILREPKEAVRRADAIVFTKVDRTSVDLAALREDLRKINDKLIFLETIHKARYFYGVGKYKTFLTTETSQGRVLSSPTSLANEVSCDLRSNRFDLSYARGKRAILVSSIGDPEYFAQTVQGLQCDPIEHFIYEDHYNYKEADIKRMMARCDERSFDMIITTEKDAVKFNRLRLSFGNYVLLVLAVEMEILSGRGLLIDRLNSLYNS